MSCRVDSFCCESMTRSHQKLSGRQLFSHELSNSTTFHKLLINRYIPNLHPSALFNFTIRYLTSINEDININSMMKMVSNVILHLEHRSNVEVHLTLIANKLSTNHRVKYQK